MERSRWPQADDAREGCDDACSVVVDATGDATTTFCSLVLGWAEQAVLGSGEGRKMVDLQPVKLSSQVRVRVVLEPAVVVKGGKRGDQWLGFKMLAAAQADV
jgi:hypothetical protein